MLVKEYRICMPLTVEEVMHHYHNYGTVCPGSSDPPEKIFSIFASENEVYTVFLTITILKVEYYSFADQNNFRSLFWIE